MSKITLMKSKMLRLFYAVNIESFYDVIIL